MHKKPEIFGLFAVLVHIQKFQPVVMSTTPQSPVSVP